MAQHTCLRPDKRSTQLAVLFVSALLAAGCGDRGSSGAAASEERAALRGRVLFDRVCATCHGRDANGVPRLGKGLRDNEFSRQLSDRELIDFLIEGRPATHPLNSTGIDMPPRGGDPSISEEDLAKIVAYLRTL